MNDLDEALTVSVALCTFNGARYLAEQLASIGSQTRVPDELVVCDDRSTDETPAIVAAFASTAPFPVRFRINESNLGLAKNFEQAISLCSGSLIALCDQDDVWLPFKLSQCARTFQTLPDTGLVFTDAEVVDQTLQPLGYRLSGPVGLTKDRRRMINSGRAFAVLAEANKVTGASCMFRAYFRDLVLPVHVSRERIHDGWIALLIAAVARIVFLEEPSLLYRQHGGQHSGLRDAKAWGLAAEFKSALWRTVKPLGAARLRRTDARSLNDRAATLEAAHERLRTWRPASDVYCGPLARAYENLAQESRYTDRALSARMHVLACELVQV